MNKRDLYQEVTDRIIAALENGHAPWVKPWSGDTAATLSGMPVNAITSRPYHGVNVPLLWTEERVRGFATGRWLTFRQARDAGAHVRKGEKGTLVVFFKPIEKQAADRDGRPLVDGRGEPVLKTIPLLRGFTVFNVDQVEDLPEQYRVDPPLPEGFAPIQAAEATVTQSGVMLRHGGDQAFYTPVFDRVQMPPREAFVDAQGYYGTLLHELTHWTGHQSRLAREGIIKHEGFGSESYAFEELVAELGSAFLCAQLGIHGDLRHEGYIASWLSVLRKDKRAIFRAASQARKAADFLVKPSLSSLSQAA